MAEHYIFFFMDKAIHNLKQLILRNMARLFPEQELTLTQFLLNTGHKVVSNSQFISENRLYIAKTIEVFPFVLFLMLIELLNEARNLPEEGFTACVDPMGTRMGSG